jgi:hypothetical protein
MGREVPQTVCFLALEELSAKNGFFMLLQKGEDVCLDSRTEIQIPSSGGGRGLFIALAM